MTVIYVVISIILIMLLVVATHEFGHFIAARYFGVGVKQAVLGLGRPIYNKKLKSGLILSITPFPFGGYVKLFNEREAPLSENQKPFSLTCKPAWQRIFILFAGPFINIFLASLIFSGLFYFGNWQVLPVIEKLQSNSIAVKGGLQPGDQIKAINGWQTPNWSLTILAILSHSGSKKPLEVLVQRQAQLLSVSLPMDSWTFNGLRQTPLESLGIGLPVKKEQTLIRYDLLNSFQQGANQTWQYIALNSIMISKIATRKISVAALAGPLTLVDLAQSKLQMSAAIFLNFIALLSIAVGLANLLPLPSLDGGHIMYVLLEKIRGKPVSVAVEVLIYRFMLAVLFIFCMQLLANDLDRLAVSSGKTVSLYTK